MATQGLFERITMKRFNHVPGMGRVTSILLNTLATTASDEITDAALSEVAGVNVGVGHKGYANLNTAIRRCYQDNGVLWQRVRGEGRIKRIADNKEFVAVGHRGTRSIRRISRRTASKLLCAKERTPELNMMTAQLGILGRMATKKTVKQIDEYAKLSIRQIVGSVLGEDDEVK